MIRAIEELRASAGLPAHHHALREEDYASLTTAAIEEGDGYFSPRLMTEAEVQAILRDITAEAS